jgi:ribonuclease HI
MTSQRVYTDGSALGPFAGWAILIDDKELSGFTYGTNNFAELFAIYQALIHVPPHSQVTIVTDSKLAIGWLARGWRTNQPEIADLVYLIQTVREYLDLQVVFEKVKGHAGDPGNELVDYLSREQASGLKQRTSLAQRTG